MSRAKWDGRKTDTTSVSLCVAMILMQPMIEHSSIVYLMTSFSLQGNFTLWCFYSCFCVAHKPFYSTFLQLDKHMYSKPFMFSDCFHVPLYQGRTFCQDTGERRKHWWLLPLHDFVYQALWLHGCSRSRWNIRTTLLAGLCPVFCIQGLYDWNLTWNLCSQDLIDDICIRCI